MDNKLHFLKKLFTLLFVVLIFYLIITTNFFIYRNKITTKNNYDDYIGKSNKVILFIGDGMGQNHIKITEKYLNRNLYFTNFVKGEVTTFSNAFLTPTDSAAAASALATGKKVDNGEVSRHKGENIETISEYAKNQGLGVGIVTTDSLTGATPSAFSSHANNRGDDETIISGQLISNIDLFLGAGLSTYELFQNEFQNHGYLFCNSYDKLTLTSSKIIGSFNKINNYQFTNSEPTLESLTSFAIQYLELNFPNGYFLMIEGAHIDKKSHDNDIFSMMAYLENFEIAIEKASNLLKDIDHTIIITADHETGGLQYYDGEFEINNSLYKTTGHTSNKVNYFIESTSNISLNASIDNTDIHKLCRALLTKRIA